MRPYNLTVTTISSCTPDTLPVGIGTRTHIRPTKVPMRTAPNVLSNAGTFGSKAKGSGGTPADVVFPGTDILGG